jgi:purine-nucleoside phosphorylase
MLKRWGALDDEVVAAGRTLAERLGAPEIGVVLGSGWSGLAGALGAGPAVPRADIPGFPECRVDGHDGGVAAADLAGRRIWFVTGRVHAYEGRSPAEIAFPVRVLAAAGARGVVLTCAAGGLLDDDRPGDLAVVEDHLNLQGLDALAAIAPERRDPPFLDLQGLYDAAWAESLAASLRAEGCRVRAGVLACVRGPCYETAAEVRMLRVLGADLASMSTVPEAIAARYESLRVAAVACVSNRGAGLSGAPIGHAGVLDVVRRAVGDAAPGFAAGLARLVARHA